MARREKVTRIVDGKPTFCFQDKIKKNHVGVWHSNKYVDMLARKKLIHSSSTISGWYLEEESIDDLVLYFRGKPILFISIPEKGTQWNCVLPAGIPQLRKELEKMRDNKRKNE